MADILRRSARRVKKRSYEIGDVVEIEGSSSHGRLVSKTSDDGEKSQWTVAFDDGGSDKELPETTFGDVLKDKKRPARSNSTTDPPSLSVVSQDSPSESKKITKVNKQDVSGDSSSTSDAEKAARASAREERSRRRQALMQDKEETRGRPNKKQKKSNEECIKVPMRTGTLILYRGLQRRAEFVRKF